MSLKQFKFLSGLGLKSLIKLGPAKTINLTLGYIKSKKRQASTCSLDLADTNYFFLTDTEKVRAKGKKIMRETSLLFDASQIESTYPFIFKQGNISLRYAYLPARKESKGLVVLFHGHNAFLHAGPMQSWSEFDILAPWDNFGWNRQGSWFWGDRGNNYLEPVILELINTHIKKLKTKKWFCFGGSMGGFAALYYAIKYMSQGIYVMCPQVDLQQKVIDYGSDNQNNPYGYLKGDTLDSVPNIIDVAEESDELPPLFITQHQFDSVNLFAEHGFKLLDVYNKKQAWYGARIHPAIGHISDGTQKEAEKFFQLIIEKSPSLIVDVFDKNKKNNK